MGAQDETKDRRWMERPLGIAGAVLALALLALVIVLWRMGPEAPAAIPTPALEPISVDTARTTLDAAAARTLAANEGVWRATRTIVGLAAVQLALGVVGLAVIARTLSATRETLGITRDAIRETEQATLAARETVEIARASERAYLRTRLAFSRASNAASDRDVAVDVSVENVGRTPAHDVMVSIWRIDHRDDRGSDRYQLTDQALGTIGAGEARQAARTTLDAYAVREARSPQFTLTSEIGYQTVFGDEEGRDVEEVVEVSVRPGSAEGLAEYELIGQFHITTRVYQQAPGNRLMEMLKLDEGFGLPKEDSDEGD